MTEQKCAWVRNLHTFLIDTVGLNGDAPVARFPFGWVTSPPRAKSSSLAAVSPEILAGDMQNSGSKCRVQGEGRLNYKASALLKFQ